MSLSAVNALRTSFSSTIESLKAKRAAVTIAEESLSQGSTGQTADVTGAEANVSAAIANLEKTIIRAPISGTINRLDIDVGSFVSASVPLVYISNKRGLEATVFVSERDIRDVAIGAKAVVSGIVEGKVVRVAQALDPITKKAEVKIALPSDAPLVSGQSASIEISRAKKLEQNVTAFTIPIAAVKITPDGAVVFTVENGALQEHALSLGALQGSTVEVSSGLTPDMEIVSDARGLKTGQTVTLK
jgi:HlyD family secretion protein